MVKQSYYFSHDSNARNDPKICELRAEFGWEGYGIFWGLIEIMSEQENYFIDNEKLKYIAFSMNLKPVKLERYVRFMLSNGLLTESNDHLTSKSLLERMRQKEEKSNKMKENALKKYNKNNNSNDAIAEQNISKSSAKDEQTGSKSSALNKGKEIKERKGKEIIPSPKVDGVYDPKNFTSKHLMPDNWKILPSHYQKATDSGLDKLFIQQEAQTMFDWSRGNGEKRLDWNSVFHNWIKRAIEKASKTYNKPSTISQTIDEGQKWLKSQGEQS